MKVLDHDGKLIETGRITKVLAFRGIERVPVDEAEAGDIVAIAGLPNATVAMTICDPSVETPIPAQPIDPPTLAMTFRVNDSPLAGTEGSKVTGRMIRDRLLREAEGNVALRVRESDDKDAMEVAGRGELQLGILIETMRREGFELSVSRPKVLLREDPKTGEMLEPIEEVVIDVDEVHSGIVVQKMAERKAEMLEMRPSGGHRLRLVFHAPTRGLIGYQGELLTDTRGTAIMNRLFHAYAPHKGPIQGRRNGVLISNDQGEAVAYALWNLEDRGPMMIEPGWKVYRGMIVGEHTRDNDLVINVLKGKQLTNIRTTSKDEAVRLTPPIRMTLEKALAYIEDDELVEVTPKSIRLRKKLLDETDRKREDRARSGRRRGGVRSAARPGRAASMCPILGRFESEKSNHLAAAPPPERASRSPRVTRGSRKPRADQRDFSAATAFSRRLWPVIHTINRSLIIGLEGRRVRCFYSAMSTTLIEIRRAKASDAVDVAATHDEAWRTAYQGIIPGNELDKLINRRGPDWWDSAIRKGSRITILQFGEQIAGYANYGRNRARSLFYDGEVYELYLRPEFQGLGFGRRLFSAARKDLIAERLEEPGGVGAVR